MNHDKDYELDEEELEILEWFQRGELRSPPKVGQEMELAVEAARNTLEALRQVTLHVTEENTA